MVLNTTCTCNACANISGLGLKIVMHCGEYATTAIGSIRTLSGPTVIAVHRLLKNRIAEQTGGVRVIAHCLTRLADEAALVG